MSGRSPRWFTGIKYPYEANFADNTWEQIKKLTWGELKKLTWREIKEEVLPDGANT